MQLTAIGKVKAKYTASRQFIQKSLKDTANYKMLYGALTTQVCSLLLVPQSFKYI